ncbi:MAG: hypothetical protein ABW212_16040, partial [Pseudonocardia sediminis]
SPAVHVPAQRSAPVDPVPAGPAPADATPSRRPVAPGSSGVEATVRVPARRAAVTAPPAVPPVPAQRLPVAPETIVGTPPEQQVLSPAPVVVGRDTRLAVLWTLLGATMGVLILVAAALVLPLL